MSSLGNEKFYLEKWHTVLYSVYTYLKGFIKIYRLHTSLKCTIHDFIFELNKKKHNLYSIFIHYYVCLQNKEHCIMICFIQVSLESAALYAFCAFALTREN